MTNRSLCDNSRRQTFRHLCEPGGQRTHSDAPGRHPAHPGLCHNHLSAVVRFESTERRWPQSVRTLSRCRVSRSSSRVAHRSCSQRASLVAATPSAASAAMNSSFSCVSNICAAAEDVVTHRWVTDRHETSTAQLKRRWTHLGQPTCDSRSKGLSRHEPPPRAHGHSRRHTHPSGGALEVC